MARIYVGTCGWVYGAWKERFYPPTLPDAQRLGYFANRFETTEVNYSFYQVPSVDTYKKWLEVVPSHFVFALKANRLITHAARLRDVESAWADFLTGATALGPQLGPILLQLPPSFAKDHAVLAGFLEMTRGTFQDVRLACEFRHPSWFVDETWRLLRQHRAALCIADGLRFRRVDVVTADFAYLRFHGRTPPEAPFYADGQLRREARCIEALTHDGLDAYVYFNNDALAHAPINAARLKELLNDMDIAA